MLVGVTEGRLGQFGAGEPSILSKAGLELGRKVFFMDVSSMTNGGMTSFDLIVLLWALGAVQTWS